MPSDHLQRLLQQHAQSAGQSAGGPGGAADIPQNDTAETVYISSLALLKILKHARAGVPMEVMGLLLGEFVDDWTISIVDYFAMPQSGTGVSVEAIDAVYQQQFLDALKQTGRNEVVCGWGHSHPGFGCWLSGVDVNTAQSFEALNARAVSLVVDPIQSVRGKVVADTFRTLNPQLAILGMEPRQTTSNAGSLNKPSIQALIHGLNRHYYSLRMEYRLNDMERKMLLNLNKPRWSRSLAPEDHETHAARNRNALKEMVSLAGAWNDMVKEEMRCRSKEELAVARVGKVDARRRLADMVRRVCDSNCSQALAVGVHAAVLYPSGIASASS